MSLQQRCLNEVQPVDRERGVGYFYQRRVSLGAREAGGIAATVEGSSNKAYEVCLDWAAADSNSELAVSCTCPRFEDYVVCKHVWATIIAFDSAQFTEPVPGKGPLRIRLVTPASAAAAREPARESPVNQPVGAVPGLPTVAELLDGPLLDGDASSSWESPDPGLSTRRALVSDAFEGEPIVGPLTAAPAPQPEWRQKLSTVRAALTEVDYFERGRPTSQRVVWYRINVTRCFARDDLVIDIFYQKAKKTGGLTLPKKLNIAQLPPAGFADANDRAVLELLLANPATGPDFYRYRTSYTQTRGVLPAALYETILPDLCGTERLGWITDDGDDPLDSPVLAWDSGDPWRFVLELHPAELEDGGEGVRLSGSMRRGNERRGLEEPILLLASGIVVWTDEISRLEVASDFPWISLLRREGELVAPRSELDDMLHDLVNLPELPQLEMPEEWRWSEERPEPRAILELWPARYRRTLLEGRVIFDYDGLNIPSGLRQVSVFDTSKRRLVVRDKPAEEQRFDQLEELGVKMVMGYPPVRNSVELTEKTLLESIPDLLAKGWLVEAEGRRMRPAGSVSLSVASGIDWFELQGDIDFDGVSVALPRLLRAVRQGERRVVLDDGSQGMLPEEWLERYGALARLAHDDEGDAVRYLPSQAALLDALLAAEPEVDYDQQFARVRQRLASFEKVEPAGEPRGFRGELRGYQRDGLGWLKLLQELGLGGCLADDMGLGKTVQVLALLQARRLSTRKANRLPSLIVAPRSLVYNWIEEAQRFTPRLRMTDYSGPGRARLLDDLSPYDALVTTYGLMRRDIAKLKDIEFDYVVLDEAQAIKNSSSQGAKASRLVKAKHRLALTGTPVENHLGELWSIFEFLNPGMLGRLPAFKKLTRGRSLDEGALGNLGGALRPFILRRTKEQVLKDLPAKTEQTLYCKLERPQWKLYKELRDHYRASLDKRIEADGLGRNKIHVLEALLRLRQAACHPGLVDEERSGQASAKLDALLEQLDEILEGGHKALVFSQFVRFLSLLKERLDKRSIDYEYLDGRTRKRQPRIDRFQNDPDCRLFLISLKAGGLGLNLTAADYVFILDPWWNPAVESQAVDRAHRIGQTRPVFAYRLIASDTVEEKILELQKSKRKLADAILAESGSMIRDLSVDDLRMLLS